ncbi:lysylphosphatidylglycerol synthase domain-containing protein [Microvirga lenta]|uniref:lysylphosphatidylglycerol synthase domain-containing protein n=2 Tax=Microvirga TaxID=186650 RepID=UPI001CFFC6F9|nr:lysylphosphatidylglycerol synthase domain-containing protein [Microvirga lenta]MCB5177619.1 lysylphosphatidylglycerol synthase domain-containing protein [Microvirga lenta]
MNDMSPNPVSPPAIASADALHPKERRSHRFAWIGMAASILLFGASLVVLWHIVSEIDTNELKAAFTAASFRQIGLAVLFTAVSYGLLTCYDAIALRQLKLHIPYRTTALASFTSYAVSFTLGFPLLTAGTVRYWIYASKGVSGARVASLTVIAGVTFWLGMALVLSWSMIRQADDVASLVYTSIWLNQFVGLSAGIFVVGYLVWVSIKRRMVKIQGWKLELPGFRLSIAQILIGAVDVCAGAGVLFVLLPGGHNISFETFVAVYIFAVMLGVASHAPGGLGVFEATILLALSSYPREPVLGALLLYRLCYYLVPFVVALALLGAYEIRNRMKISRDAFKPDEEEALAE